LIYKLRSEQLDQIDNPSLHQALKDAHTYTIQAELVSQLARPRVPELGAGNSIDPMAALRTYLESREDLKSLASEMLEAAESLLEGDQEVWLDTPEVEGEKAVGQLRLL
jgi:exonuclease SbcD